MITGMLRGAAMAIAIAAAIDPPVTMTARERPRVALVVQDPTVDAARTVSHALAAALRSEFEVVLGADATAGAVVAIGREYPDPPPSERQPVFTVTLPPAEQDANVRVSAVRAPRNVLPGTLIHLEIDLEGSKVTGVSSLLTVRTGSAAVDVGRASHVWSAARERWRAALDVTPLDLPPWRLRVEVSTAPEEPVVIDNTADVLVDVSEPLEVVVYEPRLSWAGTFVRRALERDPRFDVRAVAYPSRGVKVTTGEGFGDLGRLVTDRTRAIVVGGLDRLTSEDAGILVRFLRERGGAVVLSPDSRLDMQTASRWLPMPPAAEVLLEQPARLSVEPPLASMQASELLTFDPAPGMRALAENGSHSPVVAVAPVGAGRLVVSGALDAWRFRANDSGAFDRFWQSAVAGIAAAASPAIDVEVVPPIVAPGGHADVRVRIRRPAIGVAANADLRVSAALAANEAVRLWPGAEPDTFLGSFTAPTAEGANRITVTAMNRSTGLGNFIVASGARVARSAGPPLALLAEAHGGQDVGAGDVRSLTRILRQRIDTPSVRVERRPMRSPWWLVPFVACLGGEWWLRRRKGLR